uniref:Uncharacterized protein n=1 Tax=Coccidioides posadasii RMSCC 3488 TaxID=454284 RepID=A0A0J6FD98_COCPO|nr:hypothetical protein CPAG_04604 [Coccidioides posadasii RMSCC 3488]
MGSYMTSNRTHTRKMRFLGNLQETFIRQPPVSQLKTVDLHFENLSRSKGFIHPFNLQTLHESYKFIELIPRLLGYYMLVESVSRPLGILQEFYKFIESIPRFLGSYMLIESVPRPLGILQTPRNSTRFYMLVESVPRPLGILQPFDTLQTLKNPGRFPVTHNINLEKNYKY